MVKNKCHTYFQYHIITIIIINGEKCYNFSLSEQYVYRVNIQWLYDICDYHSEHSKLLLKHHHSSLRVSKMYIVFL